MANIKDVAQRSGYSVATVSRALNHHGYVSETAQAKIEAAIAALNYVPNGVAQDLSQGKTFTIGVVLPHMNHPYFNQLVHGILTAAFSSAYQISLLPSRYDVAVETKYLTQLKRKLFDGLIFASHEASLQYLTEHQSWGPVVVCEDPGDLPLVAVYPDRQAGYLAALQWLKQGGIHQIGFLFARPADQSATTAAALAAYRTLWPTAKAPLVVTDVLTYQDGYQIGTRLLAQGNWPQALFTNGDAPAAGLQAAFAAAHQPAPQLIGQENQLAGRLLNLPTIDNHLTEIGQQAFRLATEPRSPQPRLCIPAQFLLPAER